VVVVAFELPPHAVASSANAVTTLNKSFRGFILVFPLKV
jgi:hypothetical protein